jgi:hypothetical protein
MAYDEKLADRIRQAVGPRAEVTEKKMFGGIAFLLEGKMGRGRSQPERRDGKDRTHQLEAFGREKENHYRALYLPISRRSRVTCRPSTERPRLAAIVSKLLGSSQVRNSSRHLATGGSFDQAWQ